MTSDEPTYPQEDGEDGADLTPETLRGHAEYYRLRDDFGDDRLAEIFDAAADAWQLLIDAVNESDEPCPPECDSIAHAEGCPHIDRAAWMAKQQATIVDLRKELEEAKTENHALRAMLEEETGDSDADIDAMLADYVDRGDRRQRRPAALAGEKKP